MFECCSTRWKIYFEIKVLKRWIQECAHPIFKRNLLKDIDDWMVADMKVVAEKLEELSESNPDRLEFFMYCINLFHKSSSTLL